MALEARFVETSDILVSNRSVDPSRSEGVQKYPGYFRPVTKIKPP